MPIRKGDCRCGRVGVWIYGRGLCWRCYSEPATRASTPPTHPQRAWLKRDSDDAKDLLYRGWTYEEIARFLGDRTPTQVRDHLRHLKRRSRYKHRRDGKGRYVSILRKG